MSVGAENNLRGCLFLGATVFAIVGLIFLAGALWNRYAEPPTNNYVVHPGPTPAIDPNHVLTTPKPQSPAELLASDIAARKAYIKQRESALLDRGMDVYLSLQGKKQDELVIKYVLVSRPMVHALSKDQDFLATLRRYKFVKVRFTDGYDESWTMPLE